MKLKSKILKEFLFFVGTCLVFHKNFLNESTTCFFFEYDQKVSHDCLQNLLLSDVRCYGEKGKILAVKQSFTISL